MKAKAPTKRRQQAERSKNEIYDAAIRLFAEKGFEATTIRDIIQAAGVSVGNFYHYFSSKSDIIDENFARADKGFQRLVDLGDLRSEGSARIVEYMEHYGRLIASTGFDFAKQLYSYRTKVFLRQGRPMQTGLTSLIEDCQRQGSIVADLSAEEICRFIFVSARGVVFDWCLRDGDGDIAREMRDHVARLVKAFEAGPLGRA